MSLGYEDCKVFVSTVDSQSSAEGGIIIQVVGELSNRGGPWRKFAQTFFLAEQPNGYFVLNDIFRYIKEESDEDEAVADEASSPPPQQAAAAAPSSTQQQEVTYDQLNNASIVGGQQASSSTAAPAHQDFELAQQHGAPADAAGVTVAPPTEAHQEDARANLEELASGQTEQQQVVELHEDLTQEQLDSSAAPQQSSAQVNGDHSREEEAQAAPSIEVEAPASEKAAEPAAAESPSAPQKAVAKAAPAQASAPAAAQAPPKPSAPKTWANLAAAGQTKWKPQVMAAAAGVTSSNPTSSTGASRSSTPGGPSDKTDTSKGEQPFQQQQSRGPNNNKPQQQQQSQQSAEPRKFTNVETPYSIILTGITEEISHGMLRSRLSEAFAQQIGARKKQARISYLDIDRRNSIAYVDFEEKWALEKALSEGNLTIDGTDIVITEGKGDRRDATGLGTGRLNNAGKGRGQGQGPKGPQGANAGGPNRGGPRDGQQRSERGGRGGPKQ